MKINLKKDKKYPEVGDVFKFKVFDDFYLLVQNEWDDTVCAVCLRTGMGEFIWESYEVFINEKKDRISSVISGEEIEIRLTEN